MAIIAAILTRIPHYLRYVGVSAMSLGIDMAVFLILIAVSLAPTMASGCGYITGVGAHWLLSSRLVFGDRLAEAGGGRIRQQSLFFGSALAGLLLTMAIVGSGAAIGMAPWLAKLVAVAISFQMTYVIRQKVVFG